MKMHGGRHLAREMGRVGVDGVSTVDDIVVSFVGLYLKASRGTCVVTCNRDDGYVCI